MPPAKPSKKQRDAERRALIDEYGQLDAELAPVRAKIRRYEELAKTIRAWHADTGAGMTIIERGAAFHVIVGPKSEMTLLAPNCKLYEVLGHDNYLDASRVTLTALQSALAADVVATLTRKERQGFRALKVVPAV